ncbi:MAG: bis(5'-nucleosyl)-tetraphosphatase (symmetrical) [Gammaproteobacteria bacterium 39-13]|nr:symmetrical bis(5'-nucleosyl)-tetraphosphatase [Gammaproteobacteria bacterium]OJV90445.1 MAG: bis(5'-nucleosyl)-tetraphosphatase (symmetrical) [Gammaproteobacteria bacterium 39-13]
MTKQIRKKQRTFAIGDVQGCLEPLQQLLEKIHYDPKQDQLWFTGDLVNRGPDSLETLRFIQQLPEDTICVLGNHDLALLAVGAGAVPIRKQDTFNEILIAQDRDDLLDWLRQRPVLHHDPMLGFTLTHAGILPAWDLSQAIHLANELENAIRGPDYLAYLQNMYGNDPQMWDESLTSWERLRFITNAFTRMRFCTQDGALNMQAKGGLTDHANEIPWFTHPFRRTQQEKIVFGHWAALRGHCEIARVYPIDSGCVWGNCLTALCLQTEERIIIKCREYADGD